MEKSIFLIVGDSHSVIWEGNNVACKQNHSLFEGVKVVHLGPALAYNLLNKDQSALGKWGAKVVEIIQRLLASDVQINGVMLCFGEIDIRTQVIARAIKGSLLSIEESTRVVSDRIIKFASILFGRFGFPVLVWEPVPSGSDKALHVDSDFPRVGTETERNFATYCMSKFLREGAAAKRGEKNKKIYAFGIYEQLADGFETKIDYFEDGCHLNLKGFQVALNSLHTLCVEYDLDLFRFFQPIPDFCDFPFISNVARYSKLSVSSELCTPSRLSRIPGYGWCFHTDKQINPSAVIDIGYAAEIFSIVIYNRFDECYERAKNLSVFVGNDLNKMLLVYNQSEAWGGDGKPLVLECTKDIEPVQYVAMQLRAEEYFHLGEVQINVKPHPKWDIFLREPNCDQVKSAYAEVAD